LGLPRTATRSRPISPYYGSSIEWAVFFQDEWKVRPNLTLNWGLRYERHNPWVEQTDRLYSFDPATGSVVVPNSSVRSQIHPAFPAIIPIITAGQSGFPERALVRTDTNDLAPRFGFAWRSGWWDVVVRGGYGVFYNFESRKAFAGEGGGGRGWDMVGGPFVATETFDNRITSGVPLWQWPQAFPAGPARALGTQDIFAPSVNLTSSYAHQWNFTLEKQIRANGIRLSYIGTSGVQLPFLRNLNQPLRGTTPFSQNQRPLPYLRNVNYLDKGGNQIYNALQVELNRRLSRGLAINTSFTWAKNITDTQDSSIFGGAIEDNYDRARERGNERYTKRLDYRGTFLWEVPVGRERPFLKTLPAVAEGVLGGWTINTILTIGSGPWFSPAFQGRDISGTNVTQGRPDRICDGNLPRGQRTINRWFDASCFVLPEANSGRFGNSGRAVLEGPGWWGPALGLFKYFSLPGRESLKLRVEGRFSNVLNHPRFFSTWGDSAQGGLGGPDPTYTITSPSVGRLLRAGGQGLEEQSGSRTISLGLRLSW